MLLSAGCPLERSGVKTRRETPRYLGKHAAVGCDHTYQRRGNVDRFLLLLGSAGFFEPRLLDIYPRLPSVYYARSGRPSRLREHEAQFRYCQFHHCNRIGKIRHVVRIRRLIVHCVLFFSRQQFLLSACTIACRDGCRVHSAAHVNSAAEAEVHRRCAHMVLCKRFRGLFFGHSSTHTGKRHHADHHFHFPAYTGLHNRGIHCSQILK